MAPDPRPLGVRKFGIALVAGLALLVLLVAWSVMIGTGDISLGDAVRALIGRPSSELDHTIVVKLRLPRALVGVVAGGCLALAGALSQAATRNALASPDLTGVSAGVVLLTVVWVGFGPTSIYHPDDLLLSPLVVVVGAVGGAGAGLLVLKLASGRKGDPVRLVLTGVIFGLLMQTVTSFILMVWGSSATLEASFWFIGSLNARVWPHWNVLWPWAAVLVPVALAGAGWANLLQLGDDVAAGLGVDVRRARAGLFLVSATLTAGALVVVGAIGFIGLVAPHITRRLVGGDLRRLLPASLLAGAILLSAADVGARAFTTRALPTGTVTALLGAAFFLMLLMRQRRR
ncbi:MAG: FecCD family ABC transporter permease [Acidimicrobiales bacterium]